MKTIGKIVGKLSLILLLIGIVCVLIGACNGGFAQMAGINMGWKIPFVNINVGPAVSLKDTEGMVITDGEEVVYPTADVKNLKLDLGACQISIVKSEDDDIHVTSEKKMKIQSGVKNGELKIKSENIIWYGGTRKVVLALPADMSFDEVKFDMGAGACVSRVPFSCDKFNLDVGAGSVDISDINAKDARINIGAGDAAFSKAFFEDANIDVGMGNCSLTGDITDDLNLDVSMGSVSMILESSQADHKCNGDTAMGNIKFGKSTTSNDSGKQLDKDVDSQYNVDCSMGSVEIEFKD